MIPADRGGKGLKNESGGVQTNRGGTYVVQIEVVGRATKPFTDGPCKNLDKILNWLDSLGIPPVWPAGQPKPYPESYGGVRSTEAWSHSGHFSHGQVPENVHGDPGAVDIKKLTNYGSTKPNVVVTPTPDKPTPPKPVTFNKETTKALQNAVHVPADGVWGPGSDLAFRIVRSAFHRTATDTKRLQKHIGTAVDGVWGPKSQAALVSTIKKMQDALHVKADGAWGKDTDSAFLKARTALLNK
jgi:hypothetical protein